MSNSKLVSMTAPEWEIKFQGEAGSEANKLAQILGSADVPIGIPQRAPERDAELGAAEIILTAIVSAALESVLDVAITRLGSYLLTLAKKLREKRLSPEGFDLKVIVKTDKSGRGHRELLSLKTAAPEEIQTFIENLKRTILKTIDAKQSG